jgi:Bacterial PH domain
MLALQGSLQRPLRWFGVLCAIPFVITVVVLGVVTARGSSGHPAPPLLLLVLIPAAVLIGHLLLMRRLHRIGVSVADGELVVNTGLSTKRIALTQLRKHGLRVIDLRERTEFKPWLRIMGTSLPGLASGWFRLRNGQRALCLLLERDRVSYLRSDEDNTTLLLSLREPDVLRALLER